MCNKADYSKVPLGEKSPIDEILHDHFEVLWAKDTELRCKQLAKLQAKLEVSDTECVQAAALHD